MAWSFWRLDPMIFTVALLTGTIVWRACFWAEYLVSSKWEADCFSGRCLIDNGRRGRPITGPGSRPLKSLSHMLKGKQGRFRQNFVSVNGLTSQTFLLSPLDQLQRCLNVEKATWNGDWAFKPFVMREIVARDIVQNVKLQTLAERGDERIWDILAR